MRSFRVDTDRLGMQVYESGPEDGVPVVLHPRQPLDRPLLRAPLRRRAGALPADRARHARVRGHRARCRSTPRAGCATGPTTRRAAARAGDRRRRRTSPAGAPAARRSPPSRWTGPVASLTFIDPVSPYGFGARQARRHAALRRLRGLRRRDRQPGVHRAARGGRRSGDGDTAPRNVLNTSYWRPDHASRPSARTCCSTRS